MNGKPAEIYAEETIYRSSGVKVRITFDEASFNNWQAVYKLMSGSEGRDTLTRRYFTGTVEWNEVKNDDE